MQRLLPLALLSAALLAPSLRSQNYYAAALDGAQEVPPVVTTARGWGVVRHDPGTSNVSVHVFHEGLSAAPTAAHLHLGNAGATGGIILPLTPVGTSMFVGSAVLGPTEITALGAGGTYLNVHTAANPNGEIRGQVVTSVSTRFTGVLSGAQQVPPVVSTGTGTAIAWLHEPENRVVYEVTTTGLTSVQAAHFHQAPAGSNGPVVVTFNGSNGTYCGVSDRLTAAQVTAWKANGFYANIHTAAQPGGELRAQMLMDAGDHFAAAIDGASEVPPVIGPGLGSASLVVAADGTITVSGEFAGLSAAPSAAHVHFAAPGANGPIVFPLTIAGSTLSASHTPSALDLTNLRAGNWYVNVHTAANPGGEIRGQLRPAELPTTFGEGCLGSNGVRPQIGATKFPVIGDTMSIDLYGALPNALAVFVFGISRDFAGTVLPLPIDLPLLGIDAPTCHLLVDSTILLPVVADPLGCASQPLTVPFNPVLRGLRYYAQWFPLDPQANPALLVASNALTLRVQ